MKKTDATNRINALEPYQILDTLPESEFDNITRLAAYLCDASISLITLLDDKRQFFKSHYGWDVRETPIEQSFCAHALHAGKDLLAINDARKDKRFAKNPLVTGKPRIVFYAGTPLVTPEGVAIGTLCVIDSETKTINEGQQEALKSLAGQVMQLLELRRTRHHAEKHKREWQQQSERLSNIIEATRVATWEWNVQTGDLIINERWAEIVGYTLNELKPVSIETWYKLVHPDDAIHSNEQLKACFNREREYYDVECRMIHKDGHVVWVNDRGRVVTWTEDGKPLIMMGTHTEITERKAAELELASTLLALKERVKEQACLAAISNLNKPGITIKELLQQAVDIIPQGWQHADIACAFITYGTEVFASHACEITPWFQSAKRTILDGRDLQIKVSYSEQRVGSHGNVFLPEENQLIESIATTLSLLIDQLTVTNQLKENQQQLEQSYAELQKLMDQSLDMICVLNEQGIFVKVSAAVEHILGYKPEEVTGRPYTDFIHPEDAPKIPEVVAAAEKGLTTYHYENRYIHKNGNVVPLSWSISRNNEERLIYCVARDTSEILEANKLIQESEALMNEAQRVAKMGNWNFDFRTDKLTWSDALYDVFGDENRSFKETHGSFVSLVDETDRELVVTTSKHAQETGEPFHIEYRITTPSGEKRIIEEYGYAEKDEQGKVVRLFGTAQNITERRRAEDLLLQSQNRFRALVENSADAIVILDGHGQATYASPSIKQVLGYTEEEALTLNLFHVLHPDDAPHVAAKMEEVLKNPGIPIKGYTSRTKHKDGSWRWLEATITNMLHDPNINGIIDNFRDVTQRIEALQKLQESEKKYLDLFNTSPIPKWIFDLETLQFVEVNEPALLAYGYSREEFLSMTIEDIRPKQELPILQQALKVVHTSTDGLIRFGMVTHQLKSGELIRVDISGRRITYNNRPCLIIASHDVTERENMLRQLEETNERFHYINKVTNDAIYEWDIETDVYVWGDGFERTFGHQFSGKSFTLADWVSLMHPADAESNKPAWDTFLSNPEENKWHKEFRFKRADGTYAYAEEIGYLIRDAQGKPIRMIGVLRDVSEKQQRLHQKQIQQQVSEFFATHNPLRTIAHQVCEYLALFNDYQTAELWLTSADESHIKLIAVHVERPELKPFAEVSWQLGKLEKGDGLPGCVWRDEEVRVWDNVDKEGAFLRLNPARQLGLRAAFGLPLKHNDKVVGVLVFCSNQPLGWDIPKLELYHPLITYLGSELVRKHQEEEMMHLYKGSPDILAIASPHGRFVKVNPAFCDLLGYSEEEIINQPFNNFIHPDDLSSTVDEYNENITGRKASNFTNRYITKSGQYRWIEWSSSDVFGEDGYIFAYGRDITEVKELERLLANSARLARIGSWEVDTIKNTLYWSKITHEIHEVDDDYKPDLDSGIGFYREDARDLVRQKIEEGMRTGQPWDFQLPIITAKGNERWVRSIGQAEFHNGKVIRLFGSFQDIHKEKKLELALQQLLQERNTILESIGDAFFAVDRNWTVLYWNKEAEKVLGRKREAIVGKNLWEEYADAVGLKFYTEYHRAMNTGENVQFDEYYPATDQWFEVSTYPSEQGLSVYFKDVSIRKIAEREIHQSNERFEKIAEATNDAVWDFDAAKNELFWGKGFSTQFGYDLQTIKPSFDLLVSLIHPDDRQNTLNKINRALNDPKTTNWFEEYRFMMADGNYAFVIDRAVFIRDEFGRAKRIVGAMTDISYRKDYEDSLQQLNRQLAKQKKELELSNRELEQFAYIASHDLQEPLRMVTSFLTQLERRYGNVLDDKAQQYIHFAVDGAKRMRQIILDLLEFSRVGRHTGVPEWIDLNELVKELTAIQRDNIEAKGASIQVDALPALYVHRLPITQVFQNLIGNGLKYAKTAVAPQISIKAKKQEDNWLFSVQDNGIGIDKEYYDKIFVIFQRLHTRDQYGGTGIGLSIVKKIIENFGGRIWVESEIDQGSTFYFTLPHALVSESKPGEKVLT
jgi:PAS domain S-box-containing protein